MIPRNFSRYILLASSLAFVALASAEPIRTDALATHPIQGSTMTTYCSSQLGGNVVYISKIFDVIFPRRGSGLDTSRLNNAFRNYLVEYDFKGNAPYAAGCRVFETLSQAEASRRQIISQAQQANKQIVELKWNPGPIVAVEYGDGFLIGTKTPPPAHTFCLPSLSGLVVKPLWF